MTTGPLERIAAGDRAAAREMIDRYGGLVWSLARRACPTTEEAEDAVQEVFAEVWKSAGRFNPRVASEPTFIAMIARRRLIDRRRRAARQPLLAPLEEASAAPDRPSTAPSLEWGEDAARAAEALLSLGEQEQRVIRLAIYQGLSHEQIAEATGLPLGTVKTHIRRGLIKVRRALEGTESAQEAGATP